MFFLSSVTSFSIYISFSKSNACFILIKVTSIYEKKLLVQKIRARNRISFDSYFSDKLNDIYFIPFSANYHSVSSSF